MHEGHEDPPRMLRGCHLISDGHLNEGLLELVLAVQEGELAGASLFLRYVNAAIEEGELDVDVFEVFDDAQLGLCARAMIHAVRSRLAGDTLEALEALDVVGDRSYGTDQFIKGQWAQAGKKYRIAYESFSAATLNEFPWPASCGFSLRGELLASLGLHDFAVEDFSAAIQLLPGESDYFRQRANSEEEIGRHVDAAEDLMTAERLQIEARSRWGQA